MGDQYTDITTQGWFSRIGGSIKGMLFGLLLFVAAFPLLWWNEGRSVERYNSLNEGLELVVSVPSDRVDPANNAKLVHTQGLARTDETLRDDVFGVFDQAIKLIRNVSMYQWKQNEITETRESTGGAKTTKKTYEYVKEWSDHEINSNNFKRSGYSNPPMFVKNKTIVAQQVHLGQFLLNSSQVNRMSDAIDLSLANAKYPAELNQAKVTMSGDEFYVGNDPANPHIGDLRIRFQVVKPRDISIVSEQQGNSFSAYQTKAGSPIDLLDSGLLSADAMFTAAQQENTAITWFLRLAGIFVMWLGLYLLLRPLAIVGSVLPFVGRLIAVGAGIFALIVTLPFAFITISLAWILYRPILAAILIAGAIVIALASAKFLPRKELEAAKGQA